MARTPAMVFAGDVFPSNQPWLKGMPRCGQLSRMAKTRPSARRPSTRGMSSSMAVESLPGEVDRCEGRVPIVVEKVAVGPEWGAGFGRRNKRHLGLTIALWARTVPLWGKRSACSLGGGHPMKLSVFQFEVLAAPDDGMAGEAEDQMPMATRSRRGRSKHWEEPGDRKGRLRPHSCQGKAQEEVEREEP